ncbi:hypothetical protein TorRG33x02_051540 [Trema orientale]|uniref:Uncharacterized protein n=1 Tax=Trema orientale TaxID=63057 RepID=A0A2P5FM93_TREOI|nr:hypothetical protein TorRG33x02_051540 [Trema orientale]
MMTAQMIKLISSLDDTRVVSGISRLHFSDSQCGVDRLQFFTYFLAITTVHSASTIHVASTSTTPPSITSSSGSPITLHLSRAASDRTKGNRARGAILMFLHGAWCWAMAVGWPSLMTLFDGLESWQGVAFEVVHQGLISVGMS